MKAIIEIDFDVYGANFNKEEIETLFLENLFKDSAIYPEEEEEEWSIELNGFEIKDIKK